VEGAAVVAAPVIVSTLTTVLAFLPSAFLGGLEGKFMWMMPLMVALVLGASLVECLLMLPGHLAHGRHSGREPPRRWFRHVQARFDRLVLAAIRHRYRTIGLFVLAFVAIVAYGALVMRFSLYPDVDIDTVNFKVELPEGASFDYTVQKAAELEALIRERVPAGDLLDVTTRIGHHDTDIYGATEGRNPAWALLTLYMLPQGQRKTNSNDLIHELRRELAGLAGFKRIVVEPLKDTPVAGKPVELEIIGNDPGRFALAEQLQAFLEDSPGVTEVWTSYKPGKDVVELELVNDSLVLVHSLNRRRTSHGDWLADKGIADGTASRLRPILITSLTTVAGLLPTAYGLAGSNPFVTPMVLAMAWGILFGTVISLLLVPCLYAVDQDLKRGVLRRAFGRGQ
jgi:multidrug efflux pump subunit AcrB